MPKATPLRQEPLRRRISIPQVDTSTQRWWETQDDPSVSIRLLIREEIEKNGYVDKLNHPVEQQPRRGRPPASAGVGDEENDSAEFESESEPSSAASDVRAPEPESKSPRSSATLRSTAPVAADAAIDDDAASVSALDDLMNN